MAFYAIVYGPVNIEKIFIGQTKKKTVQKAREFINAWPEYAQLSDDEIIELAINEELEFDLVKIDDVWPQTKTFKYLLYLCENFSEKC